MPLGNPEAYMAEGMPPEQAMAMAYPQGGPPMGPPGMDPSMMGAPPVDPLQMLLSAVMQKWDSGEAQMAGEKSMLMETLAMIAQSSPPAPQDMFAEGNPMNAGMMPSSDPNMGM